ncbi:MAG: DMT family transporter [Anaerolineaceae bacterium]|jgi:drug/metabolite transporter (DMT)-like permease|nr:DMT family transporter [Anaerolineaceae bacterium]
MKKKNLGVYAAIASAVFLGLNPIFGKHSLLAGFTPLTVVTLRTAGAALLLFVVMFFFKRKYLFIYPVGLIGCLLAGFINGAGSILYYTALARLDASIAHLLYSFYPLFLVLWQLLDSQHIHKTTLIRLVVSTIGVVLLVSAGGQRLDMLGALLMIGSAILYALHLLINQRVLYEVPAPTVTLYTLLSMTLTVTIAYILFDRQLPLLTYAWWPIIGMNLFTFASRLTLFLGIKHLGSVQTAMLGLGELLVTVLVAVIWLGDQLYWSQWLGAAMLAISLLLVAFDQPPQEKPKPARFLAWLNPPQVDKDIPWRSQP